ncbi:MAG: hypothetical protein E7158_05765 [Firmicutes bacterium]|nr:hypothetical protein [Bacillota bacterium]
MNKKNSLLIFLIIITILAFGTGLFLFLRFAKENVLENKVINIGDTVDNDINNYIKNNKNCTLDVSNVDSSKKGIYKYYIKCKRRTLEGKIEVK